MQKYLEPILTAAVFFPLLAALFTLPYMIYCYRRYGAVLVMRVALMYAFLYYLICVYFLAILPFPREGHGGHPADHREPDSFQLCAGRCWTAAQPFPGTIPRAGWWPFTPSGCMNPCAMY